MDYLTKLGWSFDLVPYVGDRCRRGCLRPDETIVDKSNDDLYIYVHFKYKTSHPHNSMALIFAAGNDGYMTTFGVDHHFLKPEIHNIGNNGIVITVTKHSDIDYSIDLKINKEYFNKYWIEYKNTYDHYHDDCYC